MVAVPFFTAVIKPLSTVTTLSSLEVHVNAAYFAAASEGVTVAVSCAVSPFSNVTNVSFTETDSTFTPEAFTVTVAVAVFPLLVAAVIVVVPSSFAVTVPSLTVATDSLLDVHVTSL